MKAAGFISKKIRFDGKVSVISITVSFIIVIAAISVSAGFRDAIHKGVTSLCGDIVLFNPVLNEFTGNDPVPVRPSYLDALKSIDGVVSVEPAVCIAGVLKTSDGIKAVMFKGTGARDSSNLGIGIPSDLSAELSLTAGDKVRAFFVGEKVKARNFTVTDIWDSMIDSEETMTIYAGAEDLRRIIGWNQDKASRLEITLDDRFSTKEAMEDKARETAALIFEKTGEDEPVLIAEPASHRYPQLFDWLSLIHVNVLAILVLMIVVAGFNMISGLLIMLFRHIATIGLLKSVGMSDKGIAEVFLRSAAGAVSRGMLIGNVIGIALCLIQKYTLLLRLDPKSYFISYVPITMEWGTIIAFDVIAFAVIMLLLTLPSLFISRVDPAKTVRTQ